MAIVKEKITRSPLKDILEFGGWLDPLGQDRLEV